MVARNNLSHSFSSKCKAITKKEVYEFLPKVILTFLLYSAEELWHDFYLVMNMC